MSTARRSPVYDRARLAELFAHPLLVVSARDDTATVSVSDANQWAGVLDGLLDVYRSLGVADAEPLDVRVTELTPTVASVHIHWRLRRADGDAIYDFTAVYTLAHVGERHHVVAIAHDELGKMEAAMGAGRR
jgi:hypothetical protein